MEATAPTKGDPGGGSGADHRQPLQLPLRHEIRQIVLPPYQQQQQHQQQQCPAAAITAEPESPF